MTLLPVPWASPPFLAAMPSVVSAWPLLRFSLFAALVVALWPLPPGRRPGGTDRGPGIAPGRPRWRAAPAWVVPAVVGLAVAPVAPVLGLLAAGAMVGVAAARRRAAARRSRDGLVLALPDALDLCAVVLGAGGTLADAVAALAEHGPAPVRPAAERALRRTGAGLRLDDALRLLRDDLGPVFQPLTGALLLAHQQGGSIGVLLGRLAAEASGGRRRLGELRARRLPVALLGPLIVCSLPAVLIGAVVPLALVALGSIEL